MEVRLVPGEPALVAGEGILAVSDLHIGYERALEAKGIHVPEQTALLTVRIRALQKETSAHKLVILGDVKNDIKGSSVFTAMAISAFFRDVVRSFEKVYVVPGNHDAGLEPLLPAEVHLSGPGGLTLNTTGGKVGFFHGHAHPSAAVARASVLVTGHQHLILARQGSRQGIWVRIMYGDPGDRRTLVLMPAFNPLLTGVPAADFTPQKWKPVLSKFLDGPHDAEVFLMDGSKLGRLEELLGRLLVESD